ncbi:MAG: translation initiation factor [Bacteroidales bacterium]|nr:translation initiation factor [Bacteroidales bacterium]
MDWKQQLAALAVKEDLPAEEPSPAKPEPATDKAPKQTLCLRYEKRNGKPATIVSEFDGPEEALKELARRLKSTLGIGGSAKDDEILLQGDVRQKVTALLRSWGYRLKGEVR